MIIYSEKERTLKIKKFSRRRNEKNNYYRNYRSPRDDYFYITRPNHRSCKIQTGLCWGLFHNIPAQSSESYLAGNL
jgi:hypothetical protein